MSKFDAEIAKARSRHHKGVLISAVVFVIVLMSVTSLFVYSRGVSIKVMPDDAAKVAQISVIEGLAFSASSVVYSISEETRIVITAKGFANNSQTFRAGESGDIVEVAMRPLPGILDVRSAPELEDTRWSVNGERKAIAPSLRQEVEAGIYEVETDNRHFEVVKRKVTVERGGKTEVVIALTRIDGKIEISSLPAGATVSLDAKEVGKTPLSAQVAGGVHQLAVALDGYWPAEERIEITNTRREISRNFQLLRKSATIGFDVKPRGGTLLLDGLKVTPGTRHTVEAHVPHEATYTRDGYFSASHKFKLTPGETKTVTIHLKPEFGVVAVTTDPPATIKIKGAVVGEAPIELRLPATRVDLDLSKPGYRTLRRSIVPSSARTTRISEKLVPEAQARLDEAPKRYTNSEGSELILFLPTDLEMGAPRHERGQRANEFQRQVKLTRPFYAARHETTRAQFARFKGGGGASAESRLPMTSVNWLDAVAYCNWLSAREKLKPFYVTKGNREVVVDPKANGYRLLTEAEWEWLARRAGRARQTMFPWGDATTVPSRYANIADEAARGAVRFYVPNFVDGFAGLGPVGSFAEEKSGLFDLTGNASEWVHDFYSLIPPPSNKIEVDPLGPAAGDIHVVKGSNWRSGTRTTLRAAYRDGLAGSRDDVGFRIGRYL